MGEQPLPQYGMCLLGSFNLTKYVFWNQDESRQDFDFSRFKLDIRDVVPMMDNIIDDALYPLEKQKQDAMNKRRIGLGITGLANAIEIQNMQYGSAEAYQFTEKVMETLRNEAYLTSIDLAKKKGPFPLFDAEHYLFSEFAKTLPEDIRTEIRRHGIRNSHLLSIAPTGTISFTADNISSGIEPVFAKEIDRRINFADGPRTVRVKDYAWHYYGVEPVTADQLTPMQHVDILNLCSRYVDSACSKTCNIGDDVSWEDFKNVYIQAYEGGASGCTTFRAAGKRFGIMQKVEEEKPTEELPEGTACFIDPATGQRTCE